MSSGEDTGVSEHLQTGALSWTLQNLGQVNFLGTQFFTYGPDTIRLFKVSYSFSISRIWIPPNRFFIVSKTSEQSWTVKYLTSINRIEYILVVPYSVEEKNI